MLERAVKWIGESGFWRVFGRAHAAVYRASGGRLGSRLGGFPNLLLTTTGRRSGEPRTVPLVYFRAGPHYVLIASNGGSDRPPAWWLNLEKEPAATVQVGSEQIAVRARAAQGAERTRLWEEAVALNRIYATYEQIAERTIPVVVLEPEAS